MTWLALDIGGANLKLADGRGTVAATPFALWKAPERLTEELKKFVANPGLNSERIAVTMTGELVDCFASKTEGVRHILAAVNEAFPAAERWIYLVDGRFVRPEVAAENILLTAASNWHALASFAGRYVPKGNGLLIDVGSTTCDIIPLFDGQPIATGTTDTTRLLAGELCYTGVERSPCFAYGNFLSYRGRKFFPAQEVFATMKDVYLVLGTLPENPEDHDTADGRSAIIANAARRLGKLICADELEFNWNDARSLAEDLLSEQAYRVYNSISRVMRGNGFERDSTTIVFSGHGEFLGRAALNKSETWSTMSLMDQLGPTVSRCATAHALAVLAREAMP